MLNFFCQTSHSHTALLFFALRGSYGAFPPPPFSYDHPISNDTLVVDRNLGDLPVVDWREVVVHEGDRGGKCSKVLFWWTSTRLYTQ